MFKPELPLTVPQETWDAIADAVRPTFADSYLSKAIQTGTRLTPHTTIAYDRLRKEPAAMAALHDLKIILIRPLPFAHLDRPNGRAELDWWNSAMRARRQF